MSIKDSNEITVKIKVSLEELVDFLQKNGFVEGYRFLLNDTYFVPEDLDLEHTSTRDIIAKAILVRDIVRDGESPKLTFKKKVINNAGEILSQEATSCNIVDAEEAKKFLKVIGYKEIMTIKESDIEYEKDGFSVETKDIAGGDLLMEVETERSGEFCTIEAIKEKVKQEGIPFYEDNYFVKKAEVELNKILGR